MAGDLMGLHTSLTGGFKSSAGVLTRRLHLGYSQPCKEQVASKALVLSESHPSESPLISASQRQPGCMCAGACMSVPSMRLSSVDELVRQRGRWCVVLLFPLQDS